MPNAMRLCPQCDGPLQKVEYPSDSPLNRDQWESTRAGDYYCTICTSDAAKSGHKYFWERDLQKWTDLRSDPGPPPHSEDPDYEKYREYHRKKDILLEGHVQEFWNEKCREFPPQLVKGKIPYTSDIEAGARRWLVAELRKLADHIEADKWPQVFGCFVPKDGPEFKGLMAEWRVVLSHPWPG